MKARPQGFRRARTLADEEEPRSGMVDEYTPDSQRDAMDRLNQVGSMDRQAAYEEERIRAQRIANDRAEDERTLRLGMASRGQTPEQMSGRAGAMELDNARAQSDDKKRFRDFARFSDALKKLQPDESGRVMLPPEVAGMLPGIIPGYSGITRGEEGKVFAQVQPGDKGQEVLGFYRERNGEAEPIMNGETQLAPTIEVLEEAAKIGRLEMGLNANKQRAGKPYREKLKTTDEFGNETEVLVDEQGRVIGPRAGMEPTPAAAGGAAKGPQSFDEAYRAIRERSGGDVSDEQVMDYVRKKYPHLSGPGTEERGESIGTPSMYGVAKVVPGLSGIRAGMDMVESIRGDAPQTHRELTTELINDGHDAAPEMVMRFDDIARNLSPQEAADLLSKIGPYLPASGVDRDRYNLLRERFQRTGIGNIAQR
jgi:hypothetical protein